MARSGHLRSALRRSRTLRALASRFGAAPYGSVKSDWSQPFEALRQKWSEIPTGDERRQSAELLALDDDELLRTWRETRLIVSSGAQFSHRGWYHELYGDALRGKRVLDVGSGFGIDSLTFAERGARLTYLDIEETNLRVIARLAQLLELRDSDFVHLKDLSSLAELDGYYDVIMAMGSLHHAPVEVIRSEAKLLIDHLRPGGRWLQLAYPRSRWLRDGSPPFNAWGQMTDGPGTPWAEWYDAEKLLGVLWPATFEIVLEREFHDGEFVWFDLRHRG